MTSSVIPEIMVVGHYTRWPASWSRHPPQDEIMGAAIREEGEGMCAATLHAWCSTGGAVQCCVVEYTVLGQEKKKKDALHP